MPGPAIIIVESGGLPITEVEAGAPVFTEVAALGVAVTLTENATPFVIEHIPEEE